MEALKDYGEIALGFFTPEVKEAIGLAEMVGDAGAAGYDCTIGDTQHCQEHVEDVAWDVGGEYGGPTVEGVKTAKDTKEAIDESVTPKPAKPGNDYGGTGAKWGAMLGAFMGLPGMIGGAALGGIIGTELTPEAEGKPVGSTGDEMAPTDFNNVIITAQDAMAGKLPPDEQDAPMAAPAPLPTVEGPPAPPPAAPPPQLMQQPTPAPTPLQPYNPPSPFGYYAD